ncbi:DNA primase [Candidatus Kaiserbacteria bacterium GWA2_50_9]|uniref:DNA primase n=1 Tax=Candidatus Kaiserbacteria bacterium GWA2_50_9 TaxID=1798474 RepID=A0A1F6BVT6_9BACT|nr:MAG: DNA primase [Candidatus Kaiserbacteria bacterium GWA2_50_9]
MATDTVQHVKDRLSIVDVVSGYVKLERAGQSLRARCPFHAERTPSFFVSPERGTYHCFGCQSGGDIFSFVQQIEGLDFKGALKILAEKAGVPIVYEKKETRDARERLFELLEVATIFYASHLTPASREYLLKRGLTKDIVQSFRIGEAKEEWSEASNYFRGKGFSEREILDAGLAKKGERGLYDRFRSRIIFPIADSAGRIVGFSGRIFLGSGEQPSQAESEAPKYLNSPETALFRKSKILYGFDRAKQAIRKYNCAILVEGQMDLLASHGAGWTNTVAVSGTAFTPEHASLIRRMSDNLVIALDADEAGLKAAGRAARAALQAGLNVKVSRLPKGKDPAELILEEGADAWKTAIRQAKDIITFLLDALEEHLLADPKSTLARERFRRGVESAVLPFLADVQSPILREQYVHEIAERLGVREQAVGEAFEGLPRAQMPTATPGENVMRDPKNAIRAADRVRQAFALLLWAQGREKPVLDPESYAREFKDAIGTDAFKILEALPDSEKEGLRFSAENLHGESMTLKEEGRALLTAIELDRLRGELAEATAELKEAELTGDEGKIGEIMRQCKQLTTRIAELGR